MYIIANRNIQYCLRLEILIIYQIELNATNNNNKSNNVTKCKQNDEKTEHILYFASKFVISLKLVYMHLDFSDGARSRAKK